VNTENFIAVCFVIYDCGQWQVFKHIVDLLEHGIGVVNVLLQSGSALLPESPVAVHVSVFVIASEQEDLLGVLQLERHQQADHL